MLLCSQLQRSSCHPSSSVSLFLPAAALHQRLPAGHSLAFRGLLLGCVWGKCYSLFSIPATQGCPMSEHGDKGQPSPPQVALGVQEDQVGKQRVNTDRSRDSGQELLEGPSAPLPPLPQGQNLLIPSPA